MDGIRTKEFFFTSCQDTSVVPIRRRHCHHRWKNQQANRNHVSHNDIGKHLFLSLWCKRYRWLQPSQSEFQFQFRNYQLWNYLMHVIIYVKIIKTCSRHSICPHAFDMHICLTIAVHDTNRTVSLYHQHTPYAYSFSIIRKLIFCRKRTQKREKISNSEQKKPLENRLSNTTFCIN